MKYKELRAPSSSEDSSAVRGRVIAARDRQMARYHADKNTFANAQMLPKMIRKHCAISAEGEKLLENAITRLSLSARAHDRILKVARTIADLDASENIDSATSAKPCNTARSTVPTGLSPHLFALFCLAIRTTSPSAPLT
ncbi:MAG: hypothetical protein ABSH39_01785 [Candidatus Acidiferrum sp.]